MSENQQRGILGRDQVPDFILGAGFAGLSAAFWLKQAGHHDFRILEASNRAGGLLGSSQNPFSEYAANGMLWSAHLARMCQELGLDLHSPKATAKARYIFDSGVLKRRPVSILRMISLLPSFFRSYPVGDNLQDLSQRVLGAGISEKLVEPALGGIYAARLNELSPKALFAEAISNDRFYPRRLLGHMRRNQKEQWQLAQKEGLGIARKRGTHGFAGGMQELVDALAHYLEDHIDYNQAAEQNLDLLQDKNVLCCVPAHQTAQFIPSQKLNELLSQVEYLPMISCTVHISSSQFASTLEGFGCLHPRTSFQNSMGILFNHSIFEGRSDDGELSFTGIFRDFDQSLMHGDDESIVALLLEDLSRIFSSRTALDASRFKVHRWPRGIPRYSAQLYNLWGELHRGLVSDLPTWNLFGNYTGFISLRNMLAEGRRAYHSWN
jgi:protoporphyrinogen oxidase